MRTTRQRRGPGAPSSRPPGSSRVGSRRGFCAARWSTSPTTARAIPFAPVRLAQTLVDDVHGDVLGLAPVPRSRPAVRRRRQPRKRLRSSAYSFHDGLIPCLAALSRGAPASPARRRPRGKSDYVALHPQRQVELVRGAGQRHVSPPVDVHEDSSFSSDARSPPRQRAPRRCGSACSSPRDRERRSARPARWPRRGRSAADVERKCRATRGVPWSSCTLSRSPFGSLALTTPLTTGAAWLGRVALAPPASNPMARTHGATRRMDASSNK